MKISIEPVVRLIDAPLAETPDWSLILSEILRLFNCATGTIHTLDAESNQLVLKIQQGIPESLLPKISVIPIGKGMAGIAAQRMEAVQTCNLQTDESGVIRPSAKETQMQGAITVPIISQGKLAGTLGIAKPVPYEFSTAEIAALEEVGQAIGRKL